MKLCKPRIESGGMELQTLTAGHSTSTGAVAVTTGAGEEDP